MNFSIKKGNFAKLGVQISKKVTFTFEAEKEDACYLILVDKESLCEEKIEVGAEYALGSLRSITVEKLNADKYYYYYLINDEQIVDPYATGIAGREIWNDSSREKIDYQIYGRLVAVESDWEDDSLPELDKNEVVLYKLHVRGFSMGQRASKKNGTFQAIIQKIPYLKELGVTTIELMPCYEFEEVEIKRKLDLPSYVKWEAKEEDCIMPITQKEKPSKVNYWGYGKGNYFSVKSSYAANPYKPEKEMKQLVKALHAQNMECVMEMFFEEGISHTFVLDVLRFWVKNYHVDGFKLMGNQLPITAIAQDPWLSRTKIFSEQISEELHLPERNYKHLYYETDEYLYPARKILNHMNGNMKEFVDQQRKQGEEIGFVNYITSNNGFTLSDLFMYNDRHNEDNGEDNLDGTMWNFSNNYGVEGPTRKKFISEVRDLKWRNAMLMLLLAQGVPMIWEGDEFGNSQNGNNNAYCQDNEIGWVNWKKDAKSKQKIQFAQDVLKFRREHKAIAKNTPYQFCDYQLLGSPDLSYHGENAWISQVDMGSMSVGMMYNGAYSGEKEDVYIAYNFYSNRVNLALPSLGKKKKWYMVIESTDKTNPYKKEPVLIEEQQHLSMNPQSICVLIGK